MKSKEKKAMTLNHYLTPQVAILSLFLHDSAFAAAHRFFLGTLNFLPGYYQVSTTKNANPTGTNLCPSLGFAKSLTSNPQHNSNKYLSTHCLCQGHATTFPNHKRIPIYNEIYRTSRINAVRLTKCTNNKVLLPSQTRSSAKKQFVVRPYNSLSQLLTKGQQLLKNPNLDIDTAANLNKSIVLAKITLNLVKTSLKEAGVVMNADELLTESQLNEAQRHILRNYLPLLGNIVKQMKKTMQTISDNVPIV